MSRGRWPGRPENVRVAKPGWPGGGSRCVTSRVLENLGREVVGTRMAATPTATP